MRLRWPDIADPRQLNIAWLGAVALLAAGVLLGVQTERGYRAQATRQVAVQADILAASVSAALAFDDRNAMREYVDALKANPRLASAGVYDARGWAVVVLRRGGADPPPARIGPVGASYRHRAVTVTAPVAEGDVRLGAVYLRTSPEPYSVILTRHSALALLTVMAFLLLGVMTRAAAQLQRRAHQLTDANAKLTVEMRERAKVEDALRQSQKMEALGQLTGGIAHDFNNLLQVVHGAFELIRRKPQDHARVTAWADNGLQAAERGASLTRQLLAFSRAQKLELRPFVVADLIGEMREMLTRTLGSEIDLVFDLDDRGVPVLSDRTQLELAVLNLAINARDAMPEGGRLTIRTTTLEVPEGHPVLAPDTYVELSVADTGTGMPPEVAERAFDPFFTT
ncbi:MAG: CHASE sensor domain-containing protein, partial [Phenylobacterium sp.]